MLGRSTALILANTVVSAVLGFVALKAFAVYTGDAADGLLGQLAFAMGIAGLGSVVLEMGFGSAHVKRVSEGRDLATANGTLIALKLGLSAGFVVVIVAAAWAAASLGVLQDTSRAAIVAAALYFTFVALRGVFNSTFDGRREFAKSQLALLVEPAVRVPLFVLFAVAYAGAVLGTGPLEGWLRDGGAAAGALMRTHAAVLLTSTYTLAALVSTLAALLLFRRGYPVGRPSRDVAQDYWRFGRHIFLAVIVGTVYVNLDRVIITTFGATSNTGQYFAAQRFSDLLVQVPMAVYVVLFPALSASFAGGRDAEARRALEGALRHVSMLVVPFSAYFIVMAEPLLSLLLTGVFTTAVPTLRLLAVFAALYALSYPFTSLLNARGMPELSARIALVGTACNATLNLLLVPPAGALGPVPTAGMLEVGAALATVVSVSVQFLLMRRAAARLQGPVPMGHTAKHVAAALVGMAVLWPLAPGAAGAHWWLVIGLGLLGLGVYLGVLVLLREFGRADLDLYLGLLHPGTMARHVAGEVRRPGPRRAGEERAPEEAPPGPPDGEGPP